MPFKVTYSIHQVVVDFENIVIALQLIAAFTLWVSPASRVESHDLWFGYGLE